MPTNNLALGSFLGKRIGEICRNRYANDADDHGAHFVSHVLGYDFGVTCVTLIRGRFPGANIRAQELFARCPTVGTWDSKPQDLTTCLVFIADAGKVDLGRKVISNAPRKHVGIYLSGLIYHYSNAQHAVVQQTPDQFSHHYGAPDNAVFYGTLP